jgi:serine/threonine protein kinase
MSENISNIVFGHEQQLLSQLLIEDEFVDRDESEWIGPYRLIRLLGEGGFGQVWLAEQNEPVRREVALKLLKRGMDSAQVLARFSLERQALASMAHSNIAALLDAGSTAHGSPYFVMDYVQGLPVTTWCHESQSSILEIVGLFQQICAGLQHAHQKGIIHRDLKPSNVMVTEMNGVATAKIIDFGIAKATSDEFLDQPWVTRLGHVMGTPLYMSPEQLAGGLDVDTRSDIYSLGVLFYEMLTGTAPHEGKTRAGVTQEEFRRIVEETQPLRPSLKLTELKRQRGIVSVADPKRRKPEHEIPADLDWIILKALERDRDRRYDSAALLAADLQCFLNAEPIQARPPSARYLVGLWIRRNRVIFAAACVCFMALLSGMGLALWQAQEARKAQARAETAAQRSSQAVDFLTSMLDRVAEQVATGRNAEALKLALDGSEEKIRQLQSDAVLQKDLFDRLGIVYITMGERALAVPMLKASIETTAAMFGPDSEEAWTAELKLLGHELQHGARILVPEMLEALMKRIEAAGKSGSFQWFNGQRYRVMIWQKLRKPAKASQVAHEVIQDPRLESMEPLFKMLIKSACAIAFESHHEYDLADKVLMDCAQLCLSDPVLITERLSWIDDQRLNVQKTKGDHRRGVELARELILELKARSGGKHPFLVNFLLRQAEFENALKHPAEAIALAKEALQLAKDLAPTPEALRLNSKLATLRKEQMFARFSIADYEYQAGRREEAVNMSREAYRIADEEGNKANLAESMLFLAQMLEKTGDLEGAYQTYELRGQRSAIAGANYQRWHEDLNARCSIRLKQGRCVEAMQLAQELWSKEIQSPEAQKDTGHLRDVAELALRCHAALKKQEPHLSAPVELDEWLKLQKGNR